MQLISMLAAGVRGADNGHAELYQRGTSTRADWFEDFEAEALNATGDNIDLDAWGRAKAYVNELVDVFVYASDGTLLVEAVDGYQASNIEVISQSFTGTSYDDGSDTTETGVDKPITLESVLNLWKDTNGSIDWKVLVDGEARTIQSVAAEFSGIVYNVMDPRYGAEGDNTTDDTDAIQAAINAADTAGGGIVFFPPNTYRTTSALALKSTVSLLGATLASEISVDSSTASVIEPKGTSSDTQFIQNLTFSAAQTTSGDMVADQATQSDLWFIGCEFDGANLGSSAVCIGNIRTLRVSRSRFSNAASEIMVQNQDASSTTLLENCLFTTIATSSTSTNGCVDSFAVTARDCTFDPASVTSGQFNCFLYQNNVATYLTLLGTEVFNPGDTSVTTNVARLGIVPSGGAVNEASSALGSGVGLSEGSFETGSVKFGTRFGRYHEINSGDTTVSASDLDAENFEVTKITAAVSSNNKDVQAFSVADGQRLRLLLFNNQGVSVTFEFTDTEWEVSSTTLAVADGNAAIIDFLASGGKYYEISRITGLPQ